MQKRVVWCQTDPNNSLWVTLESVRDRENQKAETAAGPNYCNVNTRFKTDQPADWVSPQDTIKNKSVADAWNKNSSRQIKGIRSSSGWKCALRPKARQICSDFWHIYGESLWNSKQHV